MLTAVGLAAVLAREKRAPFERSIERVVSELVMLPSRPAPNCFDTSELESACSELTVSGARSRLVGGVDVSWLTGAILPFADADRMNNWPEDLDFLKYQIRMCAVPGQLSTVRKAIAERNSARIAFLQQAQNRTKELDRGQLRRAVHEPANLRKMLRRARANGQLGDAIVVVVKQSSKSVVATRIVLRELLVLDQLRRSPEVWNPETVIWNLFDRLPDYYRALEIEECKSSGRGLFGLALSARIETLPETFREAWMATIAQRLRRDHSLGPHAIHLLDVWSLLDRAGAMRTLDEALSGPKTRVERFLQDLVDSSADSPRLFVDVCLRSRGLGVLLTHASSFLKYDGAARDVARCVFGILPRVLEAPSQDPPSDSRAGGKPNVNGREKHDA